MKKILFSFWLSIAAATGLFAQGAVEVTVYDLLTLEPLEQVNIKLINNDIGLTLEKSTNDIGQVRFTGLAISGNYYVSFEGDQVYNATSSESFSLRSNAVRSVNLLLPLKISEQLEEVIVKTQSPTRINTVNAEVASEMDIEKIEEIPVEGRDITRMLFRLPNVSQATGFYPEAPNVSINGANGLFNNYLIDGMDNNERFLGGQKFAIPVGFTENVTVLTNNYSVEFGNTGNGIINITTKSGTNEMRGEAFYLIRPGSGFDAGSPYFQRDLSGNTVKEGFQRHQAGFGIGGPITKDKTFFYLNYEHTTDLKDNLLNVPALEVNETVQGTNKFNYASLKLDHFWSNKFKSSLRANMGLVTIGRQAGGLTGGVNFPSAANFQDRNSLLIANRNVFVSGPWTSETNIQYSRFRWNYGRAENPDSPNVTVQDPSGQVIALLGHPGYLFDATENTVQFQEKIKYQTGDHGLKLGVEVISSDHQLFGGGNPNGSYTVRLNEDELSDIRSRGLGSRLDIKDIPSDVLLLAYNVELRPASFGTRQNIFSVYAEDQWSVSDKLNITLGLRYDYDNLSKGGSDQGDFNNLAPRFSFNYKLDSRSSIRGGTGVFYDKILYAIYSDALQQNNTSEDFRRQIQYFIDQGALPQDTDIDRVTFDGNLVVGESSNSGLLYNYLEGPNAGSFADQRNLFSGERRILNPNGYQNPYTIQTTLGYQYQVADDQLFYADVVYNESYNLFRTRNLNAPEAWDYDRSLEEGVARSSEWADRTRPVSIIDGAGFINGEALTGVARNLVMTETEGRSRYYALSLNYQKEKEDDDYSFRLIYTLSYLENNTEDINFRAMDANDFEEEWGPSINDRRHIINAIFNWYPVKNLSLSMAALLQSGQPINRVPDARDFQVINEDGSVVTLPDGSPVLSNDLNGDGGAFGDSYVGNSDRYPGEERNSDRLPWANTFDISAQYNVPLGNGGRLEFRADIFNVFNADNLSGYSNNATQSNQIQPGPASSGVLIRRNASPPRQFQFGVRYLF